MKAVGLHVTYGRSLPRIKTRYAYDFPLCFPHELIMILRILRECLHGGGLVLLVGLALFAEIPRLS